MCHRHRRASQDLGLASALLRIGQFSQRCCGMLASFKAMAFCCELAEICLELIADTAEFRQALFL
jgi:hypothetical protein